MGELIAYFFTLFSSNSDQLPYNAPKKFFLALLHYGYSNDSIPAHLGLANFHRLHRKNSQKPHRSVIFERSA